MAKALGSIGPEPYPAEDRTQRVGGPQMYPVFPGVVVEGNEVLPVPKHCLSNRPLVSNEKVYHIAVA